VFSELNKTGADSAHDQAVRKTRNRRTKRTQSCAGRIVFPDLRIDTRPAICRPTRLTSSSRPAATRQGRCAQRMRRD
jgi:hypothetical protein